MGNLISGSIVVESGVTVNGIMSAATYNNLPCEFIVACSDLSTALTTGTTKSYFRSPYNVTLTDVRSSLLIAQTSGNTLTIDINNNGVSVLGTKLTIDNTERTSVTALTAATITSPIITSDDEITIDLDIVGSSADAKGLIVTLIGRR